ncbi:MAG: hypothetical protein A2Y62_04760 [Candidatus Fischerbacteria bacterium RBG_13_37_8]|uniref:Decarboxylase n=1 Tax=Candidatus Fischerbacteria bacterium RBG_13_37_8 TaxID=1817863 RepID=A0A1F5VHL0_9BACT|nr:MAG: hypothetical protein A2Y62_04760 [Candidatus Fischerbacteria bacterium RBG_13_37_8]
MKKKFDLELSPEVMKQMGEDAIKAVIEHIMHLPESPSFHLEGNEEISRALKESASEDGADFQSLLNFLMQRIIPFSINTPHPSYIAYIPGGGLYASAVADFIGAATNRFTGTWFMTPAAARIENNVLDWFSQWMGYPDSARGIFTSGGSLANFSAVVAARKHIIGDDVAKGTIYASNQTHHCVMKVASLAGIPENNFRLLDVDEDYRAIPELFEKVIKSDLRKGMKPFLIVGNAGTTNTGAIDPLVELADIAKKYGLWYHIDGAYGGFFNICEEGKRKLDGIEQSDSIVLDPHKGLFIPYGSGSLLVKEGELLRRAHILSADYMQDQYTPGDEVNPSEYSPELSRPFRGLRVWLPLKLYGVHAFRENLEEKLYLAKWLYDKIKAEPDFECTSPPDLTVIAFRYRPKKGDINEANRKLYKDIINSKKFYLSTTLLHGDFYLRCCILSFRTHQAQVEEAFKIIREKAAKD